MNDRDGDLRFFGVWLIVLAVAGFLAWISTVGIATLILVSWIIAKTIFEAGETRERSGEDSSGEEEAD